MKRAASRRMRARALRIVAAPCGLLLAALSLSMATSAQPQSPPQPRTPPQPRAGQAGRTGPRAVEAFARVATVLSSPRCANCHIGGDAPLQGDEGRPHAMLVKRGADGRGTAAMRCTNCHQRESSSVPHAPPGAPDWRLPPPATPMAWRGLSVAAQCRMLTDRRANGNRDPAELLAHVSHDALVLASWQPGPGRVTPPLSHEAFVQAFTQWVKAGAPCPPANGGGE